MNIYKLVKKLMSLIEDEEELQEIAEVQLWNEYTRGWYAQEKNSSYLLKKLSFIKEDVKREWDEPIESADASFKQGSNTRVCFFEAENGEIYSAFYSEKAAASIEGYYNSHSDLYDYLQRKAEEDGTRINRMKRWCGFYSVLYSNREVTTVFYGESDSYPHLEDSEKILKKAVKKMKHPVLMNGIKLIDLQEEPLNPF